MDSFEGNNSELSDNENLLDAEDLFEDDDGKCEEDLLAGEKGASDEDGGKKEEKKKWKVKESKKRIVRNPRVSLNFQRLKSDYGLPALAKTFEKFKFKGRHHEMEDLSIIMRNLEHWMCNILYPGYDFETCLRTLENLGNKRAVQSHMRKLRREAKDNLCQPEEKITDNVEGHVTLNEKDFDSVLEETVQSDP